MKKIHRWGRIEMKIDSALHASAVTTIRSESVKPASSSSFNEQLAAQETASARVGRTSSRLDRVTFSAKSLSVSASLERGMVTQERGSSSAVVSSQAKPYLSADEVSFFEKMMRKTPNYTSNGAYGQSASEIGTTFSIKA